MPYLNLDLDYFDHPKTRRLIGLLGKGSEVVPLRLWAYVGKYHAADGKLAGYSAQEIEAVTGWWGKQGEMLLALLKCNFIHKLDNNEDGYEVHDWLEHEGHIIAFKEKARANALKRWGTQVDANSNANSNAPALPVLPIKKNIKKKRAAPFPLPPDFGISDAVKKWAKEKGHAQLKEHLETFILTAKAKQYVYVDWDAAFMKAIRENWAKLKPIEQTKTSHDIEYERTMELLKKQREYS